ARSAFSKLIPCFVSSLRQPRGNNSSSCVCRLPNVFPVNNNCVNSFFCKQITGGSTNDAPTDNNNFFCHWLLSLFCNLFHCCHFSAVFVFMHPQKFIYISICFKVSEWQCRVKVSCKEIIRQLIDADFLRLKLLDELWQFRNLPTPVCRLGPRFK